MAKLDDTLARDVVPKRTGWLGRLISAGLGIVVTVVGALIVARIQSHEPHLVYSTTESLPFSGVNGEVSICQASISNDGKREVDEVAWSIRIPGAKIDQYRVMADPLLKVQQAMTGEEVDLQIPNLNPGESVRVSILATGIPSHLQVSARGRGVVGTPKSEAVEKTWGDRLPVIALLASTVGLLTSGIFTRLFRRQFVRAGISDEGPSAGGDQRQILAFLCRAHGLVTLADLYLARTHEASYWSEADKLAEAAVASGNSNQLGLTERVLLSLIEYTTVATPSRAIVYYNLALISRAKDDTESATRYMELAKKESPMEIEKRLKVDPRFRMKKDE